MLRLLDRLGALLPRRALRLEGSLVDVGIDADGVAAQVGRSELFCNLESNEIRTLIEAMDISRIRAGSHIFKQGDRGDAYFVLARGTAVVTHRGREKAVANTLAELHKPTGLGEEALLGVQPRTVTVTMQTDGIVLRIRRDAFSAFIAKNAVTWKSKDEIIETSDGEDGVWIWVGSRKDRTPTGANVLAVPLCQLRERLEELNRNQCYYCCCRDDKDTAIAAYFLTQRGFNAKGVRDGKNVAATLG